MPLLGSLMRSPKRARHGSQSPVAQRLHVMHVPPPQHRGGHHANTLRYDCTSGCDRGGLSANAADVDRLWKWLRTVRSESRRQWHVPEGRVEEATAAAVMG